MEQKTLPPTSLESIKLKRKDKRNEDKELHDFYSLDVTATGIFKGLKINKVKFVKRLMTLGFRRFEMNPKNYSYIEIDKNRIIEVTPTLITDAFEKFINSLPDYEHEVVIQNDMGESIKQVNVTPTMLQEKIYNGLDTYFNKSLLYRMIDNEEIVIKKDERHSKFFYYRNGFVEVTKNGYEFKDYSQLTGFIWKNQILDRDFIKPDESESFIEKFFKRISGIRDNETGEFIFDAERFLSLKTITGYNLHSFTETKLFATLLTDAALGQDDEPNGRTGKTLWGKALGQMLNANKDSQVYVEINGKNFNPREENRYASAGLETSLIHINDLWRKFNIEALFNDITEGIEVKRLYMDKYTIHAKIVLSSNLSVQINGESAKDRVKIFEFSDYYNSQFNPSTEFGHWFFTDWDAAEWSRFDLFMIRCCQQFFEKGVFVANSINIEQRTLEEHTSTEFLVWIEEYIVTTVMPEFMFDEIYKAEKKELYNRFVNDYEDFKNPNFKQKDFTKWVRKYSKSSRHILPIDARKDEKRHGGKDYFYFKKRIKDDGN